MAVILLKNEAHETFAKLMFGPLIVISSRVENVHNFQENLLSTFFSSIGWKIKKTYFLLLLLERKVYKDKRPIFVCSEVSDYVSLDMIIALYN